MQILKKYGAALGIFALVVAAGASLSFANLSQAKNGNSNGAAMSRGFKMGQGVRGTVAGISGNTITVTGYNGTTYAVDASSAQIEKIASGAKTTITVSQIVVGDNVMVSGTVTGTNVAAKTIFVGNPLAMRANATTGTVASINGNSLTLTSGTTTYTVDASKSVLMISKQAGTPLANSGIQVGDSLVVHGTTTGTNISATLIRDGQPQMGKGFGMMGNR